MKNSTHHLLLCSFFKWLPFLWCTLLIGHPFFPKEGVDALLFAGPTYSSIILDTNSVSFSIGELSSFTPSLSPGFTAGARILLDHDQWDGSLLYSWNKNRSQTGQLGPASLQYNLCNVFPFPAYNAADIEATLDTSFKPLFLEIGRFLSGEKKQGGLYRIHVGFAGTWENEQLDISAQDTYSMSMTQDVWGAGFRTGCNMWYYFIPELALQGSAAASLLWTRYRVRRKDSNNSIQVINVESNYWKNSAGIDMELALHAEKEYPKLIVSADLGWFLQTWTNHLHLFLLTEPQNQGNLSLQGISLTLSASF